MVGPVSIRLDDKLRHDLEQEAAARGVTLTSLMRDILSVGAREMRRQRIRSESKRVAEYVSAAPQARALFDETGRAHSNGV